jgi:hypothetical protein
LVVQAPGIEFGGGGRGKKPMPTPRPASWSELMKVVRAVVTELHLLASAIEAD